MERVEFVIGNNTYRVKEMNAIDVLAMQTQIRFKDIKTAKRFFATVLECVEVKVGDSWLPVKMEDREVYCPNEVAENPMLANEIVTHFMQDYLEKVFTKSNE